MVHALERCGARVVLAAAFLAALAAADLKHRRPNPPAWPASVRVFAPEDNASDIEASVAEAFKKNGGQKPINHGEFSSARFAFLFKPGKYHVDVPVGYYTQILGLGEHPDSVVFDSKRGVYCEEGNKNNLYGSLSTFWRGAENFKTTSDMLWATSQATPVRRAVVDGDLVLAEYKRGVGMGYSSGGFVANVHVGGKMEAASQQQYCTRNSKLGKGAAGGVWNMVYVGTVGAPESHCGVSSRKAATVTVDTTPVIAEKPFISIDAEGKYHLHIPLAKHDHVGTDFSWGLVVGFERVYVAGPRDAAAVINKWLRAGLHVVLTPGIYHLDATLELEKDNQVLLGLGFATLVAPRGAPAVRVGNVDGVRVSGIIVEAGIHRSEILVEVGDGHHPGSSLNPTFLHDVFVRVGGSNNPVKAEAHAKVMVRIASGHVVGDNLWLWRADHGITGPVKRGRNPCDTGLLVTGDHVTMYGLSVEHTLKDLVQWSGEYGATYFYQSELPYDVSQAYGDAGYAGYRVNETVRYHHAYGVGVYHYFRDHSVAVNRGIAVPAWLENNFESPLAVYLSGQGVMRHILNSRGGMTATSESQAKWLCEKAPPAAYAPPTTTTTHTTTTATFTTTTTRTATTTTLTSTGTRTSTSVTTTTTATITTTRTASTTTSTATSTMTTTTTTTTTTNLLLWWGLFGTQPQQGSTGFVPWLAAAAAVQSILVCVLASLMCCRRPRVQEATPAVPMSRLLRVLARRSSSHPDRARVSVEGSPGGLGSLSPPPGDSAARTLSMQSAGHSLLGSLSPGTREGCKLQLSPRCSNTPGRRNTTARMLSMSSIAESGLSLSPGGPTVLSPWAGGNSSPMWRNHGPDQKEEV